MNIPSFILYCVIATFSPGPANIVILSTTQNRGPRKGAEFALGAGLAFGILVAASAFLNSLLVTVLPKVLVVMRVLGALYILYLAYQIFRMDLSDVKNSSSGTFRTGFVMQFMNPKVILFSMTVIPTYVLPYYSQSSMLIVFILLIAGIGLAALLSWVIFGVVLSSFLNRFRTVTNTVFALFLVYSAVKVSGIVELVVG